MALLRKLNRDQGVTLLLVTHDPEAAAFAGRVIRMRDGRIEDPIPLPSTEAGP